VLQSPGSAKIKGSIKMSSINSKAKTVKPVKLEKETNHDKCPFC